MSDWEAVESPLGADFAWSVEAANGTVAWVAGIRGAEAVAKMLSAAPLMLGALRAVHERRILWPAEVEALVVEALTKAEGR